jgi:hypothetical protein
MQNRYVGDIGDFVKFGILRKLMPGHRLGVAWWLYPDESHDEDARHIGYLKQSDLWWHFDPQLFDTLEQIVKSGQRNVRALEAANILSGAIFASETIPVGGTIADRPHLRRQWFETVLRTLEETDLVFADPDSGLEPVGYSHDSSRVGKSILLTELRALAKPGRCLIVRHYQPLRKDGGHGAMRNWADRLRKCGFDTVDALRSRPYSPRVFFLLNAPADVRQRAEQIAAHWQGWITWHPDGRPSSSRSRPRAPPMPGEVLSGLPDTSDDPATLLAFAPNEFGRRPSAGTTQVGYVNRNGQEMVRLTSNVGNGHRQYVYVLRCRGCGHEYGVNGADIFQRRCPVHDGGAPGLAF